MASAGSLKYKVLVILQGMPAHIWGLSAAERILGSSCTKLVPATTTVDGDDMCVFVVAGWCIHDPSKFRAVRRRASVIPQGARGDVDEQLFPASSAPWSNDSSAADWVAQVHDTTFAQSPKGGRRAAGSWAAEWIAGEHEALRWTPSCPAQPMGRELPDMHLHEPLSPDGPPTTWTWPVRWGVVLRPLVVHPKKVTGASSQGKIVAIIIKYTRWFLVRCCRNFLKISC
jgi:hypothetical protein